MQVWVCTEYAKRFSWLATCVGVLCTCQAGFAPVNTCTVFSPWVDLSPLLQEWWISPELSTVFFVKGLHSWFCWHWCFDEFVWDVEVVYTLALYAHVWICLPILLHLVRLHGKELKSFSFMPSGGICETQTELNSHRTEASLKMHVEITLHQIVESVGCRWNFVWNVGATHRNRFRQSYGIF